MVWGLIGNQYHIAARTPEGNLVQGMKWFQNTFTRRINIWNIRWGTAFRGLLQIHTCLDKRPMCWQVLRNQPGLSFQPIAQRPWHKAGRKVGSRSLPTLQPQSQAVDDREVGRLEEGVLGLSDLQGSIRFPSLDCRKSNPQIAQQCKSGNLESQQSLAKGREEMETIVICRRPTP